MLWAFLIAVVTIACLAANLPAVLFGLILTAAVAVHFLPYSEDTEPIYDPAVRAGRDYSILIFILPILAILIGAVVSAF